MSHNKNQRRAEAVRKARHRKMVTGSTKQIRNAASRGLMASAMRQLERGAALETDERQAKPPKRMNTNVRYNTAYAALNALRTGAITLGVARKIAERIDGEVKKLKHAIASVDAIPKKRASTKNGPSRSA
jgi:hypothetical protein